MTGAPEAAAEAATIATLVIGSAVLIAVAASAVLGPRLRVPAPLLLLAIGIAVGILPFVEPISIAPEVVLLGVLPPLLYASSVSLPTMDLRREFGTISLLSVVLVVLTALLLGALTTVLLPRESFWWGVALGAVISPTDAVATSIVKRAGVSHRITAILEGESLLNDASALVLLRTAIAAAGVAGAFSAFELVGTFLYSLAVSIVIGALVALLSVLVRRRITDAAVGTAVSFVVPFAASLPAELLHASGLVAAVAAGLVVGRQAPRRLSPQQRISDVQNWRTVSLVLEGAVFLLMGLELFGIATSAGPNSIGTALVVGLILLAGTVVIRSVFVVPLLLLLHDRARRAPAVRSTVEELQQAMTAGDDEAVNRIMRRHRRNPRPIDHERFGRRVRALLHDMDYLAAFPLGPREGAVVVWAGMRGAVTVAAAQTIPAGGGGPPQRDLLVLIAFAVAGLSLLLQGGTLDLLIRIVKPRGEDPAQLAEEHTALLTMMQKAADDVPEDGRSPKARRLRQYRAQRDALLDARDVGSFDPESLAMALSIVDAEEAALAMAGDPED